MNITDGDLRIIYKHNKPYGIRDSGGFLFLFVDIHLFQGQLERHQQEIEQQHELADKLLGFLKERAHEKV